MLFPQQGLAGCLWKYLKRTGNERNEQEQCLWSKPSLYFSTLEKRSTSNSVRLFNISTPTTTITIYKFHLKIR